MRACYDAQSAENHHPGHQWSALLPGLARRQGKVAAYRRSRLCLKARGPPRLHSPVLGRPRGVNSDTRRPLGTRRDACGCRRDICICPIKTGFDRSVGGAVWALTAYQKRETRPQQSSDHCATALHRFGCVEAKPRRIQSLCSHKRSTVAALHARAATRAARALLPRYTRARRPWARKKRRMTSPRPST